MDIKIRFPSNKYAVVTVEEGGATIETGFLDSNERSELANKMREIAAELDDDE